MTSAHILLPAVPADLSVGFPRRHTLRSSQFLWGATGAGVLACMILTGGTVAELVDGAAGCTSCESSGAKVESALPGTAFRFFATVSGVAEEEGTAFCSGLVLSDGK